MSRKLSGKVAFVTGAGHPMGIGRACANKLAELGANVVIADLNDTDELRAFTAECEKSGSQGIALTCDVTDQKSVNRAFDELLQKFGRVDIVVNNAGVGVGDPDFLKIADRDWDISMAVNLRGVANVCTAAIPHMVKNESGSIINIASLSGLGAISGIPACYTASKFAVVGLTKQLALQYASEKIRCNAVCPGSVRTQMMETAMAHLASQEGISVEEAEKLEAAGIPLGRAADPGEVAGLVAFLASNDSAYVTGAAMPVSGGMSPGI